MNSFETRSPNGDVQRITALTWAPVNTHVPHCRLQLVQNPEVVRGLEKMHPWHPHCRSTLILRPWPLTFVSSPTVWIIFLKKTKKKNLEINAFNKEGYTSEVFPQLAIRTMSNMSGSIKGCFFFFLSKKSYRQNFHLIWWLLVWVSVRSWVLYPAEMVLDTF